MRRIAIFRKDKEGAAGACQKICPMQCKFLPLRLDSKLSETIVRSSLDFDLALIIFYTMHVT
jgi:hypothetical protein